MMKNGGKNTETWWKIEEKHWNMMNKREKKTRKNDEEEWKKWNIMKNREQQWKMVKNIGTMNNRGLEAGWLDE